MPNCTQLTRYAEAFERSRREAQDLFSSLDADVAERPPGENKWSPSQCMQHLVVTAAEYFPKMEGAIEHGRAKAQTGSAPFTKTTFLGGMILGVLDPKGSKTFRAPKIFRPKEVHTPWPDVQADFLSSTERLSELCERADGLDLDRIRLSSPIAPWPRMTLREAFEIHSLHIPRHLAQARNAAR